MTKFIAWLEKIPDGMTCSRCDEHPATIPYSDASICELNHGGKVEPLCACCYNKMALEYARDEIRKQSARIPELEEQLCRPCAEMEAR